MRNIVNILSLSLALTFTAKAQGKVVVVSRESSINSNITFTIIKPYNIYIKRIVINLQPQLFYIGNVIWTKDKGNDELHFEIPLRSSQYFLKPTVKLYFYNNSVQLLKVNNSIVTADNILFCFYASFNNK